MSVLGNWCGGLFVVLAVCSAGLEDAQAAPVREDLRTTHRLVVQFQPSLRMETASAERSRLKALAERVNRPLKWVRHGGGGMSVLALDKPVSLMEAQQLARQLAQDATVASAAPDLRVRVFAAPNDPLVPQSWFFRPYTLNYGDGHGVLVGAADHFAAWPTVNRRTRVAVVDTGARPHPDLVANQLLGHDFVSDVGMAGDGDGRDADPTDTGDFCDTAYHTDSSWHGLKVAGLIAAEADNSLDIAGGAARHASVLHVRALGRCGGWLSDIADAVRWSAGADVDGVPANPNPVRVVNLSLGTDVSVACPRYMQDAIDEALARRVTVVAAAGNDGVEGLGVPANCGGVISVGAHTSSGDLTTYTNYSSQMTLTGPAGGDCLVQQGWLCGPHLAVTLTNQGSTTPGVDSGTEWVAGTSFSAPMVSATVAMMLAVRPEATVDEVRNALVSTARAHAQSGFCAGQPAYCGAGMLDARAAVAVVSQPIASITGPTRAVAGGATVSLGAVVTGGQGPYSYVWTQTGGPEVAMQGADTATITFTAPLEKSVPLAFRVTVTWPDGETEAVRTVEVNNLPTLDFPNALRLTAGTSYSAQLRTADVDGDVVYVSLVSGPDGMVLEDQTLQWSQPVAGTYEVVILVTDKAGGTAEDGFLHRVQLTVEPLATGRESSGGGGAASWGLLAMLALLAMTRRRRG